MEFFRIEPNEGERRRGRRYELSLALRYKVVEGDRVVARGVGHTINLSSGGVLFRGAPDLPAGAGLILRVDWPFMSKHHSQVELLVKGEVVRSDGSSTAIRMRQWEFRRDAARQASLENGTVLGAGALTIAGARPA